MNDVFIHLGQCAWWGEFFYAFFSTVVVVQSRWFAFKNAWIQLHRQFSWNQLDFGLKRLFWTNKLIRINRQSCEWNWLKEIQSSRRRIDTSRNHIWIWTWFCCFFQIKRIHRVYKSIPFFVASNKLHPK